MARTLRSFAATNAEGTCLWCGNRLTPSLAFSSHFDTQTCAAEFGQAFAEAGKKFKPITAYAPEVGDD